MAEIGYERGHAAGYLQVVADVKAVQHGLVRTPNWRCGGGDPAAVLTSQTRGRATISAGGTEEAR